MDEPDEPAGESELLDPGSSLGQFYRGTVLKLRRGTHTGVIRSVATRREIIFDFQHVRCVGSKQHFDDLREGLAVGYDVSWTDKGLRVSVLYIPD